jgi:PAS domain S-box-containing protein
VNSAGSFPVVTMGALLMTLGITAIFLLYRHLKSLQNDRQRFFHLIKNAPIALFWYDTKGRILGTNDALLSLTGYRASQLKGQVWFERLLADEQALCLRHTLQKRSPGTYTVHTHMIKADGSWRAVVLDIGSEGKMGIVSVREAQAAPREAAND